MRPSLPDGRFPSPLPGARMLHPVVLGALALWLLNDHLLKDAAPGPLAGKLSDVAGLIVVPASVASAVELWRARRPSWTAAPRWLAGAALATAALLIAINLSPAAAWLWQHALAAAQWPFRLFAALAEGHPAPELLPVHHTLDPTDALTAPAALLPILLERRASRRVIGSDVAPAATRTTIRRA